MPKIYRTAQGREVDFEAMLLRNEHVPAIGNMRVNARGDELGPDNVVLKNNNERVAEFYAVQEPDVSAQLSITEDPLPDMVTEKPKTQRKSTDV
jgi:hypothetical protein